MSHFDELIKTIRAGAFTHGVPGLAKMANISDDTLRRILGEDPPESVARLRRLEELSLQPKSAAGASETGKEPVDG